MNTVGDSEYSSEVTIKTRSESMAISPVMISVSGGLNGSSVGSFRIGAYEVTQREWLSVMGYNPSGFSSCGLECPVENVSYDDVLSFISTLNGISDTKYRLPTSSEWKYAGQSGGAGELYSGGSDVDAVAWYSGNSGSTTHQVGQKQANGLGIYDMSGNVWEWSSDSKVWGGSWRDSAAGVEIDKLTSSIPATTRTNYLGFRLAVK